MTEQVKDKRYIHLAPAQWAVGHEISTGEAFNPYWERGQKPWSKVKSTLSIVLDGAPSVYMEHCHAYKKFRQKAQAKTELNGEEMLEWYADAINVLQKQMVQFREVIFEAVRREKFPNRPSRQRCIWVIEDTQENRAYWQERLARSYGAKRKWVEVECTGTAFETTDGSMVLEIQSEAEWRRRAEEYWLGESPVGGGNEVLFEGILRVVRVLEQV